MKAVDAEEYTQALGQIVAGGWRQIALGQRLGVPKALGLSTHDWVEQRLGGYVRYSIGERRQAVKELTDEGMSTRQIEDVLGEDHVKVWRDRQVVSNETAEREQPTQDGTSAVSFETATPLDTLTGLAADEKMRKRAERIQRDEAAKAKREAAPRVELNDQSIDIRFGAFQDVLADLADESVSLVLTDPPYPAEFLGQWSELAEHVARWLRPGGLLVALSGQTHLPEVMQRLGEHLDYWWCGAYFTPGPGYVSHARHAHTQSKPLLFYVRKGDRPALRIADTVLSTGEEKASHVWQQNLAAYEEMAERYSQSGELVIDPFLGAGTTALACKNTERRFIGAEIDKASYLQALERLG